MDPGDYMEGLMNWMSFLRDSSLSTWLTTFKDEWVKLPPQVLNTALEILDLSMNLPLENLIPIQVLFFACFLILLVFLESKAKNSTLLGSPRRSADAFIPVRACPACSNRGKKAKTRITYTGTKFLIAGLPEMQNLCRRHRGCARGSCCVYSMWNDMRWLGHRECAHECSVSHGRFAHCGPSLFEIDLPPLDPAKCDRGDKCPDRRGGAQPDPAVLRTNWAVYRRRCQARNPKPQAAVPSHETQCKPCKPPVASVPQKPPSGVKKRRASHVPVVQRIRKRMGSRSFGKLQRGA